MEKSGIIKKWTVDIDLEKVGINHITARMTVYTDPKESERVAKILSEAKEVLEVSISLSEELLIIVKVVARDQEELHSFIAKKVAPLQGVLRIRTSIVTKRIKEERFLIDST
jgi:DNA-binding Lrp family transcriptional regulator